jgi:hypothetical protein
MLIFSLNAQATHEISKNNNNKVIGGYDAVAYFTMGQALPGAKDISIEWLGGRWLFVNEQHRKLFLANPGKFIPQYGGYSSVSSLFGGHYRADPKSWKIVDDKLYLFYKKQNSYSWSTGWTHAQAADRKWEKAKAGLLQE